MTNEFTCLGIFDSITNSTGFSRVASNTVRHMLPRFKRFDIWGIGYNGWPSDHNCPWWPQDKDHLIYPATNDWTSNDKWQQLLNLINDRKYTHIFIIQDPWNFASGNIPEMFEKVCAKNGTKITFYVPADCQMEQRWMKFLKICDHVVAYNDYGFKQLRAAGLKNSINIIPHGVDFDIYTRLIEDRATLRKRIFGSVWGEDLAEKFVLLCVSANQRRKAHWNTLEMFKYLHTMDSRYRLLMHMGEGRPEEKIDLQLVAEQLGIPANAWYWNKDAFVRGHHRTTEAGLNELYNASDLTVSCTLGEGWGLWINESLAAGTPVAVPDHTACKEIFDTLDDLGGPEFVNSGGINLPLSTTGIVLCDDKSRLRYPVDTLEAARLIHHLRTNNASAFDVHLNQAARDWMDWKRIAEGFLYLMLGK